MRLEEKYNQLDNLVELNNLFQAAGADVSFWGTRVVTVAGYDGSLNIHEIGNYVIGAFGSGDIRGSSSERAAGMLLRSKLKSFYAETDRKGNFLTRIFMYIREFTFFNPYTVRFFIEQDAYVFENRA